MVRGIIVWTIKDNYHLGNDIYCKVLTFAFGLSAEIERNLISERTKEALARKKAEGVTLGRPIGSKGKMNKLHGKEELVQEMLNSKIPKSTIARNLKVQKKTLYKLIKDMRLNT